MGTADDETVSAGGFSVWLGEIRRAVRGDGESDVPCGDCTACCRSSQFIHIGPDESDALAHIPAALRFAAPGMPKGHVLMGYDERGHCPMLVDDRCSIYEHRPRTCRTYDCRVFPATGLQPDEDAQPDLTQRVRRWRFDVSSERDLADAAAVRAAAEFLVVHGDEFPDDELPRSTVQLAVLAVAVHETFVDDAVDGSTRSPSVDDVVAAVRRSRGS